MSTNLDTTIRLSELTTGEHHFEFTLDDAYFQAQEKSEILGGTVTATATLNLREQDYDLHLKAQGTVLLTCDRCLEQMSLDIDNEDTILPDEGDDENCSEIIDLRWLVYEMITIHLPLVHSHPDGECSPQMQQLLQSHLCSTAGDPESGEPTLA